MGTESKYAGNSHDFARKLFMAGGVCHLSEILGGSAGAPGSAGAGGGAGPDKKTVLYAYSPVNNKTIIKETIKIKSILYIIKYYVCRVNRPRRYI